MPKMIIDFLLQIVTEAGGVAVAGYALFKFVGEKFADMVMQKYKNSQEINLEKIKIELANKHYVTKKRYDKIFEIYEILTAAFTEITENVNILIPADKKIQFPNDINERVQFVQSVYDDLKTSYKNARNMLYRYIPFIESEQEKDYFEILDLVKKQIDEYKDVASEVRTDLIKDDEYERTKVINKKMKETYHNIREYLHSLEIIR